MKAGVTFDYFAAFSRNLGWVTAGEQEVLRSKRVAIAGMGGVGGSHLMTLARLGIGAFNIADIDTFELANFNRQAGANIHTLERPKVEVLEEMARSVNPELDIRVFPDGVQEGNIEHFLDDVDVYVDGLDFFAVEARRGVFAACEQRRIPAVTAAPLGMGAAVLTFLPGKMTFERYFGLEGRTEHEQLLRFFIGLAPAGLQQGYLVDPGSIDLPNHRGPSTSMGCELCAGIASTQVLKILLKRGGLLAAPHALQYDAYRNTVAHTWRPGGHRNPLQWLAITLARRKLATSHR